MKAVMGMDILRAKSPAMIDKEIAVHLLAYNLVRGIMARAAADADVIARTLSFKGTLQLVLAFQQHLRWAGRKSVDIMNAPARRNQCNEVTDSTRTHRATRDKTKTETPCTADRSSTDCARQDHPCASGLCLR